jgi:hypothetical protein
MKKYQSTLLRDNPSGRKHHPVSEQAVNQPSRAFTQGIARHQKLQTAA